MRIILSLVAISIFTLAVGQSESALGADRVAVKDAAKDSAPKTAEKLPAQSDDEAAIRQTANEYAVAFARRDAKALATLWAPDAVYASPTSGSQVRGRKAIESEFAAMFQREGEATLSLRIDSIRFITPEVAIEDGFARVARPGAAPSDSNYTVVHVKKDGKWLIDSERETVLPESTATNEQLADLEWLVGDWADNDDEISVTTTCRWTSNRAFLTRTFSVAIGDQMQLDGTQVIGWDPVRKMIRSWTFDSTGGFAEGTWAREADRWIIHTDTVMADGRQGENTNILRKIDDNHFGWQSVDRKVAGESQPDVKEVEVVRQ